MMNQQDIFKKIGSILAELNEQYQFLAQNPQQLNDLELELFLANAHFLSDHVNIVKKLNTIVEEKAPEPGNHPLLEEQNTIILPEVTKSYVEDDECFDPQELEEVVTAEEEEARVDIKPAREIIDEEVIEEEKAASVLKNDFFKPDQDDHTFEFVLGTHDENAQFDYEVKPAEEIFDRPLSKEEAEILAQKKRIHEKERSLPAEEAILPAEDDEIGPEPFLIDHEEIEEEEEVVAVPKEEPVVAVSQPIEALKEVALDEAIISPPVEHERPLFTPEAVPVKPAPQPVAAKPAQSLNDLLAKTNGKADEPLKAPIADLKQAISLNEKLLFIKDLFNGYNLAYSEAIDIVNKMNSFEAADGFLQNNYAAKNNWASKQATVDQFYELLNRRFSK
ncbi:hypothetical protein G7074_17025 [Pedobacter sp. HDW13]|uniref:hypothetical protein n=1 Tax=Pedobacter sp. HDW13 TaxID=2714940 RepID=UPI00140E9110|nr:hypothetical protein [Pedobacter sp. HDW13]QIL40814.1 hypothetical protein G7074_17025 [Pedobacter sp. HDW13]